MSRALGGGVGEGLGAERADRGEFGPGLDVERGRPVSVELELRRPSYSSCTLHLGKTFTES
jgi:hypothetical protein